MSDAITDAYSDIRAYTHSYSDGYGDVYANNDHAGTPENFKPYVIAGATGGGISYTGGYSSNASVCR